MKKNGLLYKTVIWLLAFSIFSGFMSSIGINKVNVVKAAIRDDLQDLIDNTPDGGTLTLSHNDIFGLADAHIIVEINNNITITSTTGSDGSKAFLSGITIAINAKNVTLDNLFFEKHSHSAYDSSEPPMDRNYRLIKIGDDSNVHVTNCDFDGNGIYSYSTPAICTYDGAIVYAEDDANVTFENCTFEDGTTTKHGGAVFLDSVDSCTFTNCTFTNNSATDDNDHWAEGGALGISDCNSDAIIIDTCTFNGNTADCWGGAVYINNSEVEFNNSLLNSNNCTLQGVDFTAEQATTFGLGGGIYAQDSNLYIDNTLIRGNHAYTGGGIFSTNSYLNIQNSNFEFNMVIMSKDYSEFPLEFVLELFVYIIFFPLDPSALFEFLFDYAIDSIVNPNINLTNGRGKIGGDGGAVASVSDNDTIINNTNFYYNTAEKSGGSLLLSPNCFNEPEITQCNFTDNSASANGGAITLLTNTGRITDCQFNNNHSEAGGAIYSITDIRVADSDFYDNYATIGGAVAGNTVENKQVYTNCQFEDNSAESGGALYIFSSEKDEDKNNVAISDCELKLLDCTLLRNSSQYEGGAITFARVTATVEDCLIRNNDSEEYGGAIYSSLATEMTINKSTLKYNSANWGGAIYNDSSKLELYKSILSNNSATIIGGAIYDLNGLKIASKNNLFTENTAASGSVFCTNGTDICNVINCTIANNTNIAISTANMGALDFKLRNNIIIANSNPNGVSSSDMADDLSKLTFDAQYNLCAVVGNNNITGTTDVFEDIANGDYHLAADYTFNSLGPIEAGTTADTDTQARDLDGNKRILDNDGDGLSEVDMGAYEQQMMLVRFYANHPNSGLTSGTISGDTVQYISYNNTIDINSVTVTCNPGMQFDGWFTYEGVRIDETTPIKSSMKLYAIYSEITCTVTFQYNPQCVKIVSSGEGEYNLVDSTTKQFITQVPVYHTPEYPAMKGINGYEFGGWSSMPDSITADTLLIARYMPTATYDFGTKGFYQEVTGTFPNFSIIHTTAYVTSQCSPLESPNSMYIIPYNGYEFMGWSDTPGGAVIALPSDINSSATYYAVYQDITPPDTPDKYTLTIEFSSPNEPGGSLEWISKQFDSGTIADLTSNTAIAYTGYDFIGFMDADGNYVTNVLMDSAYTLTAVFEKKQYELIVQISGGGTINTGLAGIYNYAETINLLGIYASADAGNSFLGYQDSLGNYVTNITMISDTIVTAIFAQNEYNIDFTTDNNGAIVNIPKSYYNFGDIIDLSAIELSSDDGYEFSHWTDSSSIISSTTYTVTGDETLRAIFSKIQYTLTVNINGNGTVDSLAGDYDINTDVELLQEYAHPLSGDSFLGYFDENGNSITSINMYSDRAITAYFGQQLYKVIFDSNGGSDVDNYLNVQSGSVISPPAEPDNGTLIFNGWYKTSGEQWDFSVDIVDSNIILRAVWVEEHTITFYGNGGGADITETKYSNDNFYLNDGSQLSRTGYILLGWNTHPDGSGTSYSLGQEFNMPENDVALYANWNPNYFNLDYTTTLGNGSLTESHHTDELMALNTGAEFEREGYVIDGWEIEGSCYLLYDIYSMPSHNVIADAIWALDSDKDGISDADELVVGTLAYDNRSQPFRGTINGTVLDVNGSPVAGDTIVLNSIARFTTTDSNGEFAFSDISLSPHILSLRNGYSSLGAYEIDFANNSHNSAVILDDASTDSLGSASVNVNYLFDSLYIIIQYNQQVQWEIEDLYFTERQASNPRTGDTDIKWYEWIFKKLLSFINKFKRLVIVH